MNLKAGDTEPFLGKVIKEIILASNTFIVYMDEEHVIQWSTDGHAERGNNFGKIQNQISYWETICNSVFEPRIAYNHKMLLAEAYARVLGDGDDASAQEIINQTVETIKKQGKEILRQEYLLSSLGTTGLVIITLILTVSLKSYILKLVDYDVYRVFLTGLFGGIGAFVSSMIRANNYEAEITLSKKVHRLDGFLRIIYGLIAGVIISLGIKSNMIFGFVKEVQKNNFIEFFLGIIGGASEVILPNIIKKVETKA